MIKSGMHPNFKIRQLWAYVNNALTYYCCVFWASLSLLTFVYIFSSSKCCLPKLYCQLNVTAKKSRVSQGPLMVRPHIPALLTFLEEAVKSLGSQLEKNRKTGATKETLLELKILARWAWNVDFFFLPYGEYLDLLYERNITGYIRFWCPCRPFHYAFLVRLMPSQYCCQE